MTNTHPEIDALYGDEAPTFAADGGVQWPQAALADPPRYPFSLDRFTYEAPEMAAWRQKVLGR